MIAAVDAVIVVITNTAIDTANMNTIASIISVIITTTVGGKKIPPPLIGPKKGIDKEINCFFLFFLKKIGFKN